MSHTRLVALVLAAGTVAVAGCGGSKTTSSQSTTSGQAEQSAQTQQSSTQTASTPTEPTTTGKSLAGAELIAKANAICKRLSKQAATVTVDSQQSIARTAPRLAAYYNAALADLRKLTPPAAMANDWKTIVADIQTVSNEVLVAGKYATDNDLAAVSRVDKNVTNIQRARFAIARRDGIKECGEL